MLPDLELEKTHWGNCQFPQEKPRCWEGSIGGAPPPTYFHLDSLQSRTLLILDGFHFLNPWLPSPHRNLTWSEWRCWSIKMGHAHRIRRWGRKKPKLMAWRDGPMSVRDGDRTATPHPLPEAVQKGTNFPCVVQPPIYYKPKWNAIACGCPWKHNNPPLGKSQIKWKRKRGVRVYVRAACVCVCTISI